MSPQHHRLDYTELSVTDLERATAFYRDAFGWAFNHYGPGYAGIRANPEEQEPEVGGFVLTDEVVPGGALLVLYSDDLEATERAVTEAGGAIVRAAYDFPGGRRFHFCDTEGNVLAVWTVTG